MCSPIRNRQILINSLAWTNASPTKLRSLAAVACGPVPVAALKSVAQSLVVQTARDLLSFDEIRQSIPFYFFPSVSHQFH